MLTDDPRILDTLRAMDHSLARIAASLETLAKLADEALTAWDGARARETVDRTQTG